MGESHRQLAEKKLDTEESAQHASIYIKFKNRLNETIMMDVTIDCDHPREAKKGHEEATYFYQI